jgi:hypothetical protein
MGDRELGGRPDGSQSGQRSWARVAVLVLAIGACALTALLGAGITVWVRARVVARVTMTATGTPFLVRTRTVAPSGTVAPSRTASTLSATPTPTLRSPTRTSAPSQTAAPSRTTVPSRTATRPWTPSPTPRLTATVARSTPTPWVCTDLDQMGQMVLASGQRFDCTFQEEQLTAWLAGVPDLPCSAVRVILADGEITLACRVLFEFRVSGVVKTDGCQLSVEITRGPVGFVDAVQDRVDQELQRMVGASVCVDEVAIEDGEMAIGGYSK